MEIARNWRLRHERLRLVGEICHNVGCGEKIFPPRDICPHCGQPANIEHRLSGKGIVYSYTVVDESPPAGFEKYVPYVVALIDLEEGPRITAMLTDLSPKWVLNEATGAEKLDFSVSIGMPVEMVTRKLSENGETGLINYGYKFRPVLRKDSPEEVIVFKAQEAEVPVSY